MINRNPKTGRIEKIQDEFAGQEYTTQQRYYLRHPERLKASTTKWMSKQPYWYKREKVLKRKYKITWAQYLDKLEKQNSKCAICDKELIPIGPISKVGCVDHCHKTNLNRDILCNDCNIVLGKIKEKKEVLQSMIQYLDKWSSIGS